MAFLRPLLAPIFSRDSFGFRRIWTRLDERGFSFFIFRGVGRGSFYFLWAKGSVNILDLIPIEIKRVLFVTRVGKRKEEM